MRRPIRVLALAGLSAVFSQAHAQDEEANERWDVTAPPLPTRSIPIDVDRGTWMSLDVSPDGSTIAFDLLGDLYTIPIEGGEATALTSGLAWDFQPRYSPDGSTIAFTSDRSGGNNIWIMNADGTDPLPVTDESFRLVNNPSWSADGRYIAARKHFTTERSAGTGEIWLYHLGGGSGLALVERPDEDHQKEQGEPAFSADGRYLYYSLNTTPGGIFEYAQDSNTALFAIRRYDMQTGEVETAVAGPGGAVRPEPSPDGRLIAFVRRERTQSMLYVKDLTSGVERRIYTGLDQDMQETWGIEGMYPNMDWTPDSASLVFWAGGQIRRIDVATGETAEIPFRVTDTREIIDPIRPAVDVAPATFATRMPRFAALSPDGGSVVYETLGKLYVRDLPAGEPRRLTRDATDRRELFPSWSQDSSSIAFVTWDDEDLGAVRTVAPNGARETTVTTEPGHYRRPRFSPDGEILVFEKDGGGFLTSPAWSETTGIFRAPAGGGAMTRVTDSGSRPHFGLSADRIFMTSFGEDGAALISVDPNGEARRTHASGELATAYQVSPAGDHFTFTRNYESFVVPLLPGPQEVAADSDGSAFPVVEASGDGADYPHWSHGGEQLNWSLGPQLFSARLDELIADRPAAADDDGNDSTTGDEAATGSDADGSEVADGYEPPTEGIDLSMTFDADVPEGATALIGADVLTMSDEAGGIVRDAAILIERNRIAAIGPRADVTIPPNARVVDVDGRYVIPGLIDAHAHGPYGEDEIIPQQNWSTIAHLALGVTTIHDPSSDASHVFASGELQRAGMQLGPRTYSTGEIVYGARSPGFYAEIDDIEDAGQHVRRLAAQGAHSIKNYNQPRRDQRQQVVAAAQAAGLAVVAEGSSLFHLDMALIADGNTALEHNLPQMMIYEDVLSYYSQTRVAYTPTIVVTYGGLAGDPYWRQATRVWQHPILSRHVPPHVLQPRSIRVQQAPEEDFVDDDNARVAKMLADRGVYVSIGGHGQEEGLAAHWELWSFVRGGMTPLEALRAGTIIPARHLGFDRDLGSLEPGKLADLVVLDADPLADIQNSDDVAFVMQNGRLYDAATMDEVATGDSALEDYYWLR